MSLLQHLSYLCDAVVYQPAVCQALNKEVIIIIIIRLSSGTSSSTTMTDDTDDVRRWTSDIVVFRSLSS